MIRMAIEDIGLADPRALQVALDCGRDLRAPGHAGRRARARRSACSTSPSPPKSNAVYIAYNAARAFIAEDGSRPVPLRLRNAPTRLMKGLGYGKGYRYAHDEADAYAAGERYLPDDMADVRFYEPTDRGLEARIREKLERAARARRDGASDAARADRDEALSAAGAAV